MQNLFSFSFSFSFLSFFFFFFLNVHTPKIYDFVIMIRIIITSMEYIIKYMCVCVQYINSSIYNIKSMKINNWKCKIFFFFFFSFFSFFFFLNVHAPKIYDFVIESLLLHTEYTIKYMCVCVQYINSSIYNIKSMKINNWKCKIFFFFLFLFLFFFFYMYTRLRYTIS